MLTSNNYAKGVALNEQVKFNIMYDKGPLFDIVYSGLAFRLLLHDYATELNEKQKAVLETIKNK